MIDIQTFLLILLVVGSAVFFVAFLVSNQLKKLKKELKQDDETVLMEWLKEMKASVEKNSDVIERQLGDQRKTLSEQLSQQRTAMDKRTKLLWERLDQTSQVVQGVQKQLGGIEEFGKDMKDLSNILKSPKLRGGLGEQLLYDLLGDSLPSELFKTQYKFRDGSVCDAVVKTEKGLIPIDSKFPMENFKLMMTKETQDERDSTKKVFVRDVKKRIDEIASKYILPDEDTTDFAVMYVPSENIYYELLVNTPEIEDYARRKSVFISSPNTLHYQLKSIFVAFQQQELHKHAGEILKAVSGIKVQAKKFGEDLNVLDGHILRTAKSMESVKTKFGKVLGRIESVEQIGDAETKPLIE